MQCCIHISAELLLLSKNVIYLTSAFDIFCPSYGQLNGPFLAPKFQSCIVLTYDSTLSGPTCSDPAFSASRYDSLFTMDFGLTQINK